MSGPRSCRQASDETGQMPSEYRDVMVTVADRRREIVRNAFPSWAIPPTSVTRPIAAQRQQ